MNGHSHKWTFIWLIIRIKISEVAKSVLPLFCHLTLLLLDTTCPVLANSADPDQLASEEAN